MQVMTYADLDAGRLPAGCVYFEQLNPEGKRYGAGGVLVMEVME
jgi:hypothetical protein